MKPLIFGLAGHSVSAEERALFTRVKPCGFILFRRNIDHPEQVRALTADLHALAGGHTLILIDQEGGRVARLRPPHWPLYPCGAEYGALWPQDPMLAGEAAYLGARLIAEDLFALGINVDCLPVLDVPVAGADGVIGDRAYGTTAHSVMALGRAAARGALDGGVLPIIKHIPGHGRAMADSHLALPVVDAPRAALEAHDFPPFRALGDLPLAMTAHVVFTAYDAHNPATTSPEVIARLIRAAMGFDGLLLCDDLSMQALSGTLLARCKAALQAGCDVALHCSGNMAEMLEIASDCPDMTPQARRHYQAALACLAPPRSFMREKGRARLEALLKKT